MNVNKFFSTKDYPINCPPVPCQGMGISPILNISDYFIKIYPFPFQLNATKHKKLLYFVCIIKYILYFCRKTTKSNKIFRI